MDLKLKGKSWAGNIYHQFESICQDVDDFMSKDTMKFVENQVQSVGVSVKRFCSNVVQDIVPLSEDIVEPEALLEDGGQVDMRDHVNSVAGMRMAPTCINEEQLSENHGSIDTLRNSDALLPFELDHVTQFPKPPDADSPEEAETPLHLREDGDGKDDADNGVEENMPSGSAPLAEDEIFSGTSDEDNENSTLTMASSPALSAQEAGILTIEKERISCNSFPDDTEYLSNTLSSGLLFENKLPVAEDPTSDENTSLSAASVASADKVNEDNTVLMDSQPLSACNVVHGYFLKNGILGDSFSTKDVSSDENTSLSAASVASADKVNEDNRVLIDSQPPSACNIVHGSFLKNGILGDSFSTKDVSSEENTSLSAASVASADKVNEDNNGLMNSQPPSACDVVHRSFVKNRILGDSFSTKDESFDENTSLSAASVASADKVNEDNSVLMDSQPPSACNIVHGSFLKNRILGDSFSTKDVSSEENTSLSAASVASADKVNEDNNGLMDSKPPSACDVVHRSFVKNGILGDSFSTKDESFDENTSLSAASVASADKVNEDNSVLMDSQRPSACNIVHGSFLKNGILGDSFSTKDVSSEENTSLSAASADKVNEDNNVLMDSQPPSACDVVHGSFVKNGILGDSFSTKDESFDVSSSDQSPELSYSYFSCDEEEEETDIFSSKSSVSPKSSNILESTSASFINKAENIDHSEAERNISTPSSRTAYETKAMDMLPAISILKSKGSLTLTSTLAHNNTFPSDGSDFVDGSFQSRHEEHYNDGQFAISPSEAENKHEFGLGISGLMETVDLSPDVKHDERTVPFNVNYARVASHHRRNFRYYKNLIQDAFTSRKRLSKEYEHLAIMFGDIDMESSQHFEPRSLPSSPHRYADAVRTQSSQEMYETEWELV